MKRGLKDLVDAAAETQKKVEESSPMKRGLKAEEQQWPGEWWELLKSLPR